ncbi:hypothetical protein C8N35_102402 [Breoghania corrubedonensis]|uniref:Uncharacterized protein n=1 Tax=Breoghania corrubedonensis TaxID=665038 RepID=A0A2T5VD46_9HYPH|nr:hypothetical protein C8N35_102402 [Breoghania corrubedonensis]
MESPLLSILRRLEQLQIPSFVLTCRAADWADVQNDRTVQNWFGKKPVVGRLQPLDDAEIVAMVGAFATYPEGGEAFLRAAESKSATDLARNPQALKLLLTAIKKNGWPRTKTELYQSACRSFAAEENAIHRSLNANRPSINEILSIAGFVCAQLLLSGKRGVNVDGREDALFVRLADLADATTGYEEINAAVSSLLFKSSGASHAEPYHRTVAEYLAAVWLSERLRSGALSIRRLETLLYKNGHVPRPLRGVHAWLATLDRGVTTRLVPHDPYGCFRYGDIEQYSVEQARHLFGELQNLAAIDPHFRSEDWEGQVGGGLARPELRDDIVTLIRNSDVPYQLSMVILESLKGTDLAASMREELRAVVLNTKMAYVSRDRALAALRVASPDEDWRGLAQLLIRDGDHGSARMAVGIATDECARFTGEGIAEITNAYDDVNENSSRNLSLGIAYRLLPKMSQEQRNAALAVYASALPNERYNRTPYVRKIEERLLDTLKAYLEQGGQPSARELWQWLRRVTRYQYRSQGWQAFSVQYFNERPGLRRELQSLALADSFPDVGRMMNIYLGDMSSGLTLQESDLAFHLEALVAKEYQLNDFIERWGVFSEWIFINQSFTGLAEAVARRQARTRPELQALIDEITNRPPPSWEREEEKRQRRWEAEQRRKNKVRYRNFAAIRDVMREGRHLSALNDISTAYMGLFIDINEIDDPVSRVEWLVGPENAEAALQGLIAACCRTDLPTPRAIATLEATENKVYHLAKIALVGCALQQAQGGDLKTLPRETLLTALTASQWGLYANDKMLPSSLDKTLIELLFDDVEEMEPFIRDTIEPFLFAGKNHVMGLSDVMGMESYAGLAAKLAVEWLARSGEMSVQALRQILQAALALSDRVALSDMIAAKLQAGVWPSAEHQTLWCSVAFLAGFDKFKEYFDCEFQNNYKMISDIRSVCSQKNENLPDSLSVPQLAFLIESYADSFPHVDLPGAGWGENAPYESARFVDSCITSLGNIQTPEAQSALERLVAGVELSNHIDHARHVLAEHTRTMAEADWATHTFEDVRHVLLGGSPQNIEDLQGLVMDQLEAMQDRVRNGSFNAVRPFWNEDRPHLENDCRDLIATQLEPYLGKLGVRVHTEGTMPSDTRCDLLCTIGEMDLPIEIKGQWNPEIWTAASEQLEGNYSRHYRASGRGIYLVLWFGNVAGSNPPGIRARGRLASATAVLEALPERSPKPISERTKLFVLDVSTSPGDQKKADKRTAKVKGSRSASTA